jgi:hypothetical protein
MKFNITIINDGSWTISEAATALGFRLTRRGNFIGWATKEEMEMLDKKQISYIVW